MLAGLFPYWDPFGLFWQLGWLVVLPFAALAGVIWEAWAKFVPVHIRRWRGWVWNW
jgi:hypothetical protein